MMNKVVVGGLYRLNQYALNKQNRREHRTHYKRKNGSGVYGVVDGTMLLTCLSQTIGLFGEDASLFLEPDLGVIRLITTKAWFEMYFELVETNMEENDQPPENP